MQKSNPDVITNEKCYNFKRVSENKQRFEGLCETMVNAQSANGENRINGCFFSNLIGIDLVQTNSTAD